MNNYYNHVALWLKANKPKYVIVRIHYRNDPRGEYYWSLKNTNYVNDILWIGSREFEEYINALSEVSTMKFFVFKEPGHKEEI